MDSTLRTIGLMRITSIALAVCAILYGCESGVVGIDDAGITDAMDGGEDGTVSDDSSTGDDVAFGDDGRVDADDGMAADDGSLAQCQMNNGGCDPLVSCTDTAQGPECGNCPEPYTSDGNGKCLCATTGLWPPDQVDPRTMPSQTNIAYSAPYSMDPAPNYPLCTDPDDATQLTDGQYTEGYFWTQSSTVGWSRKNPLITIDLGADRPIKGLSYNTAAGTAGVVWPTAILVFVAGPDQVFHLAGDLVSLHRRHEIPPMDEYGVHRFWTDELHTHGRYVALSIVSSPYVFVDEIEVFEGEQAWLNELIDGEVIDDFHKAILASTIRLAAMRRYISDMHVILEKAESIPVDQEIHDEILCEWDSAMQHIQSFKPGSDFKTILPFDPIHRRIFSVQARLWSILGLSEFTVWQSPRWDYLAYLADPPQESDTDIALKLMQHEYRSAQLNISNAAPYAKRIVLSVRGLPDEAVENLSVSEAVWTDTATGVPVSDALPDAPKENDHWVIDVPSGLTRQVWFTFHILGLDEGEYSGNILLDDGEEQFTVPIAIHVYPFALADRKHLHMGGWDYTNRVPSRGITEQNRLLVISHLADHFVDRPWATSSVMPRGDFDSSGNMSSEPDTGEFDQWLQMWPDADRYSVFLAVSDSFAGHAAGTQEFNTAVGQWVSFWASHAQTQGLSPDQLALLLVDEPHAASQDSTILAWANAIHDSGAGLLVWEDPTYRDMQDASTQMIEACDVLCPNRQMFLAGGTDYAQYFADRLASGTTLEFYSCSGPMRLLDPYYYLRLQAWTAWQHGASAMYFWAFSDNGGVSSWNEYALMSARAYSPSFLDETSITTSKHMEAAREGVEDFEYLYMLQQAIAQAHGNGTDPAIIQQAQELLNRLPDQVLPPAETSIYWTDPLDRTEADQARVEILQMLKNLKQ